MGNLQGQNLETLPMHGATVADYIKNLFGDQQLSALKDYLQAALKLNYNGRIVG